MGSEEELAPEERVQREMNRFRGRLAGFVEACNLDVKQERAIIRTIKDVSYDAEKKIIDSLKQ